MGKKKDGDGEKKVGGAEWAFEPEPGSVQPNFLTPFIWVSSVCGWVCVCM